MKRFLLWPVLLITAGFAHAQNKLTIVIDGIELPQGQLFVGAYDAAGFLKKPLYGKTAAVDRYEITVVLEEVPAGEYAVSVFHDENSNRKLDTGAFGIPLEKTGFSNNAKGHMGPPKYEDAKFEVADDTVIYITLE
jgi:uncharacterized protein (DUF2141 family)